MAVALFVAVGLAIAFLAFARLAEEQRILATARLGLSRDPTNKECDLYLHTPMCNGP